MELAAAATACAGAARGYSRRLRATGRATCPSPSPAPSSASSWAASPTGRPCAPPPRCWRRSASRTRSRIVSAHRTPDRLFAYAEAAAGRGLKAIIAGAGGAAHLPGMLAAKTRLPVLGVPVQIEGAVGLDSLLSIVQMPKGRAGRDAGDRAGGGGERRAAGGGDAGDRRRGAGGAARRLARGADRGGGGDAR